MPQINFVILSGRLGRNPDLKYTPNGKAVVNLSIANSRGYGEKQTTTWMDVTAWGKSAEFVAEKVKKGDEVIVQGFLEQQRWTDKEGVEKSRTIINTVFGKVDALRAPKKIEERDDSETESGDDSIPLPF